jgi:hypothetical protein
MKSTQRSEREPRRRPRSQEITRTVIAGGVIVIVVLASAYFFFL